MSLPTALIDTPILTDTHCHLDFPDFAEEIDAVIARAHAAGVMRMVTISTRVRKAATYCELAERFESVWFSVGTHPHNAAEEPDGSLDVILVLASHPKCVAIGEAGLDYHYDKSPRDQQAASFRLQIEASRRTGLPLVIHARAADDDMALILTEGMKSAPFACVMHCFSSGAALARTALDLGFYLSMSGIAAFPKSQPLRDIFAAAPLDRILLETDSPYLAPPPHRGRRNEPAYTAFTAKAGAQIFGLTEAAFAAATSANFDRLFARAARPAKAA